MATSFYDGPAETALIASVIIHPPAYDTATAAGVEARMFAGTPGEYSDTGTLWANIAALHDQGLPADLPTLYGHHPELAARYSDIISGEYVYANAAVYAARVVEQARNRQVATTLESCLNGQLPNARAVMGELCDTIDSWAATTTTEDFFSDWTQVMNGDFVGEPPTIGQRTDDVGLLYAGKLNSIIGESESGKSMIAQWIAVQQAKLGNHSIYLDFEDAAPGVGDRFRDMGATDEEMRLIHYRRVDEPWTPLQLATLRAMVAMHHPTYCVVDGVTNAMTLERLDPLDNKAVALFYGGVPSIVRSAGAAAFMVDHIPKARTDRPPGAIGAQHKRAGIDGCSLMLRMKEPAGRNRVGVGYLSVDKDRPGFLREYAPDGKTIADVTIRSDGMSIHVELAPSSLMPAQHTQTGVRRTGYMDRTSRVLEGFGDEGASTRMLQADVSGRAGWIKEAADMLVADGYATVERAGNTNRYVSVKAYRERMEPAPVDDRYEARGADWETDEDPSLVEEPLF